MADRRRIGVIGAGIIGLCAAYSLRKRGAEVVVLEAGTAGSGASHANGGWIVPSLSAPLPGPGVARLAIRSMLRPDSPVYLRPRPSAELARWSWAFLRACNERDHLAGLHATARLNERTMELYDALAADGIDYAELPQGLLFLAHRRDAAQQLLEGLQPMVEHGYRLPPGILAGQELHELEPSLSPAVTSGFLVEQERSIRPDTLVRGLTSKLDDMGVAIRERWPVSRVDSRRGRWLVTSGAGVEEVDAVLLAAGAWTGVLSRRIGFRLPLQPGKGYSFSIEPPVMPRRSLYLVDAKIGCTPIGDGLRIAGTMELSGINLRIDRRRIDAMLRGARRYIADLDGVPVTDEWTGMRPVAPDGLPILGAVPGRDGLFVATGHSMLGLTLGPVTGELMADLILDGREPAELRPFAPDRFRRSSLRRRS